MYDLKPQARPYAKAAFLAAVEEGQINEMFGDLKVLSEACSDSSINKLIESPEEKSVVVSTLKGLFSNQPVKLTENLLDICLLYTSPSPRDRTRSRMPSSA